MREFKLIQTANSPTINIQFRNLDHSEAIEKRIRDQISKLNHHFGEINGRGRDIGFPMPPAQIRTCGITAYGSYLGCDA